MADTIEDIARRIDHAGDVYNNKGDAQNEKEAREAAQQVRESKDIDEARHIEIDFNKGRETDDLGDDS